MYFQDFPVVPYPYYIGDDRKYALARNIIRRVALSEEINNTAAFIEYSVQDGERPEDIAQRVYGDSNHHWIILLTNNIVDPYHGWYKSQTTIEQYIQKRYSGEMIYFSDGSQGFTYDFTYSDGCLLTQGGNSEPITSYRETFCELGVQTPKFSVGAAAITLPSGVTTGIHIRKVVSAYLGVNHFSIDRPTGTVDGSNGALETPIVDPLAYQSSDYEGYGAVVGSRLPATTRGGATGATVEFWQTYIGKYMGVSGSEVTDYATSNYQYETDSNESKRTIKILSPVFLKQALKELKSVLGV